MSKVKIAINEDKCFSILELPVYALCGDNLYQLIQDTNDMICLLSSTGYVQEMGNTWNTIEDFFEDHPNFEVVNVNIEVLKRK